jgi:hypothetical protein
MPSRSQSSALLLALSCALAAGGAFAEEPPRPPDTTQPAAPAPPPAQPAAPAPTTFDADAQKRHVAVPLSIPQSPAMIHTGMVFTGLGLFGVVTGALILQHASQDPSPDGEQRRVIGGVVIGGGVVLAAIGIPLWTIGARPLSTARATSAGPTLWAGPRWAGVRGSF